MKKIVLLLMILCALVSNLAAEKVKFSQDSIMQKEGNYIKLLGGSSWELTQMSLSLITDDVIIVFNSYLDNQNKTQIMPIFYSDGEEIPLRYISGNITPQEGHLVTISNEYRDGAVLETLNGLLLSIPEYDRYDTGYWLPPYKALITNNGLYMWNLKKGKRVWLEGIKER